MSTTCPRCGGTDGRHGLVHVRHGNGAGHNEPCPDTPVADTPAPDITWQAADDGESVTFHRADLPAVADPSGFDITVPTADVGMAYVAARARQLGADGSGDL